MGLLQQFHLVIKYKRGTTNKLADMLSRLPTPIVALGMIMHMESFTYEAYKEVYVEDEDLKRVY